MKLTARRWVFVCMAGMLLTTVRAARAAEVTDADRMFRNFTRETATVSQGQLRVEVQGLQQQKHSGVTLNTLGFRIHDADSITGSNINLLASYGFMKDGEVGFIIPGFLQSVDYDDGSSKYNSGVGDFLMYAKIQRAVAEHCKVGGGVEITLPNGSQKKGFGTGDFGANPFLSTRYQRGIWAVGAHIGYNIYTGSTPGVFNASVEGIVRPSPSWAFRTEWSMRTFSQDGHIFDAVVMPGIDINISDNIVIRPTGVAKSSGQSMAYGYGVGVGFAYSF